MKEIDERRSIRRFTGRPVDDTAIEQLLRAAMNAPSAGNERPWEFVVLQERETMLSIRDFHPYSAPLESAACAIVVCGDTARQKFPDDYWVQDCSAATENLLLEAVHLGLGAVWLGVYPIRERIDGLRSLLGLPETVLPLCIVALGYPAEAPSPVNAYLPERIHRGRW